MGYAKHFEEKTTKAETKKNNSNEKRGFEMWTSGRIMKSNEVIRRVGS